MDAAEKAAVDKGVIPFGDAKKMFGLTDFPEKEEMRIKKGFWSEWERLAIKDIQPNEEMIKFLQRLQGSGISLNAMTARSARIQEPTLKLLEKMGIVPDQVFFRPDTLIGENASTSAMKVGWMQQTSDRFNYVAMFDDSISNVKAALKAGIPAVLQPDAKGVDSSFIEGAVERGLKTMEAELAENPSLKRKGIQNIETLIEAGTKSGRSQPRTFTSIIKGKEIAEKVIKSRL